MNDRLLDDINRNEPEDFQENITERPDYPFLEEADVPERDDLEELCARNVGTIDRRESTVVRFNLEEIKSHFEESMQGVEKEFEIADAMLETKGLEYAEAVWKSQLLFLESAFDFFMHEFNKYALTNMYYEEWPATSNYLKINIPLKKVIEALRVETQDAWFIEHVNDMYKTCTMVSSNGFKTEIKLWGLKYEDVAQILYPELSVNDAKANLSEHLDSLFERRNYLVHQSNRKHEDASFYEAEISKEVVEGYISFIRNLIDAIIECAVIL